MKESEGKKSQIIVIVSAFLLNYYIKASLAIHRLKLELGQCLKIVTRLGTRWLVGHSSTLAVLGEFIQ